MASAARAAGGPFADDWRGSERARERPAGIADGPATGIEADRAEPPT